LKEKRRGGRRPGSHRRRGLALGRIFGRRGINEDGKGGRPARGTPVQGAPRGGKRLGGVASPSPSTPPVRPNSPSAPRRVTFASSGVTVTWPVPARCPCRRGRYRPRLKGTPALLRKENFEIEASYQLAPWQTPIPTRAVVDTGAGPSVIRADMLPEGWTEYSSRAPPRTQVSDASGRLLKVNAEVSLTIYVGGTAMEYDFLVVKALSVPLFLGWDFQRNYVGTISPKTQTIRWDDGTSTVALCSWTGSTRPAPPRRGIKPRAHIEAIRLRQGVTVGPRCIQAVEECCSVKGVHLARERPVKMSRRKVVLHNAIVEFSPGTPRSLYLTNIGDAPVHLTKGYVVGTASAYNGPLHVVADEGEPGAVLTIGADALGKPDEEEETSRRAEEGIDEGQLPPHPPDKMYPKPEFH